MATQTAFLDYYEILGVSRDAGPAAIEAAFKRNVLKFRDLPGGGEQTRRINLAYRALKDSERRREYDAMLAGERPKLPAMADPPPLERKLGQPAVDPPPVAPEENSPYIEEDVEPPRRSVGPRLAIAGSAVAAMVATGMWASGILENGGSPSAFEPNRPEKSSGANASIPDLRRSDVDSGPGLASAEIASRPPAETATEESAKLVPAHSSNVNGPDPGGEAKPPTEPPSSNMPPTGELPAAVQPTPPAETPAAAAKAQPAEQVRQEVAPVPTPNFSAPARYISGGLYDSDNRRGRFQGTVGVRITVGTNGRAEGCRVIQSSGLPGLDMVTCSLLQQRLRFTPARDASGNPVASEVESIHNWGRRRGR
jgi:protein TonB